MVFVSEKYEKGKQHLDVAIHDLERFEEMEKISKALAELGWTVRKE